jgi:2-C-methyl-D-erythritol 4-phosphate cytidylyltransferase
VVARKERMESVRGLVGMFGFAKVRKIVAGTMQRPTSVANGLRSLDPDVSIVSIHDASRPCVTPDLVSETVRAAKRYGAGVAAARITDVVKETSTGQKVGRTLDASKLWLAQTPQAFRLDLLSKALDRAGKRKTPVADEAAAVELTKQPVHLIAAPASNIRINGPEDLALASALLPPQG